MNKTSIGMVLVLAFSAPVLADYADDTAQRDRDEYNRRFEASRLRMQAENERRELAYTHQLEADAQRRKDDQQQYEMGQIRQDLDDLKRQNFYDQLFRD